MSVEDNLTFALRMAKLTPAEIEEELDEITGILNIGEILEKCRKNSPQLIHTVSFSDAP